MAPQSHPQAQFVPIAPHFDLAALVDSAPNFDYVTRLSVEKLREHSIHDFEALVLAVVIQSGKPLVIEGWGDSLPPSLFSKEWLEGNLGTKPERVRDIPNAIDIPMTMGHYLRSMSQLTHQFSSSNYRDPKRQRLYLKDIDCPQPWADNLSQIIPESVYYLNECIEPRMGGDGAILEPNEWGQMGYGKGIAPAGDLMSSLPPEMRAQNMMCYIGHEGTYTPTHREMCASLGQNIMVEASRDGNGDKEGSSVWFMTETKERELVSEYFLSMLGHDIEVEKHFGQVNAWKKAPFNVWVVEQKVGDLILIPPLAPHQVWNRGTRTMKAAWNRTTVDTLELAIHEALPRARMVCRDEQYKNKAIIYYTLTKYYDLLQRDTVEPKMWKYGRIKQLMDDFRRLFLLYTEVLVSETFSAKRPETDVEFLPYDSNVTCSYCRCNIFNRFLTCKSCIEYGPNEEEDTYDICMDCYAMGRSCACISGLKWIEQWDWLALVGKYEEWRNVVVQSDGFFDTQRSPQPLDVARKRYGKKPIAEVCQEQLKLRPWNDIKNPTVRDLSPGMSDVEPEADDEGRPKNKNRSKFSRNARGRMKAVKNKTHACHICAHHDWNWKLALCTTCNLAYCYGVLWRAFDLMPQTAMEDKDWQCPKCLKICSCARCRKDSSQKPYAPKGTLLGHDTRLVADFRSVESLVNFSKTNLVWLRGDGSTNPRETSRMKILKERAEAEKARTDTVNTNYLNGTPSQQGPLVGASAGVEGDEAENMDDIDPALREIAKSSSDPNLQSDGNYHSSYTSLVQTANESDLSLVNGENSDRPHQWMDGNSDLDGYNPYFRGATYPSGLLEPGDAPIAPMVPSTQSYPDPSHIVQNRMMGAGYYRQGNTTDRILYNLPPINGSIEPSEPSPLKTANMALSDLLGPAPEASESTKKRKRNGSEDVDDLEFFTSKRQRELSKTKKLPAMDEISPDALQYRKPRRSLTQPKIYVDLGEDAVPIEEDEGRSSLASNWRALPKSNGDVNTTRKRSKQLVKGSYDTSETRRSSRSVPRNPSESAAGKKVDSKPDRRSAWLARKNAQESGAEYPSELPQPNPRSRLSREHRSASSPAVKILSALEVRDDVSADLNSLFGERIEEENGVGVPDQADNSEPNGGVKRALVGYESMEVTEKNTYNDDELSPKRGPPPKKRRGRPPKNPPPRLSSPDTSIASSPPNLLSLKERLAKKGKTFKIVSAEQRNSKQSQPDTLNSPSTSAAREDVLKSLGPRDSTLAINTRNGLRQLDSGIELFKDTVSTQAEPIRQRPTVVRLASPDSKSQSPYSEASNKPEEDKASVSDISTEDSDASIPAVTAPAKRPRGRSSIASKGALHNGEGLVRRGRGRPRKTM